MNFADVYISYMAIRFHFDPSKPNYDIESGVRRPNSFEDLKEFGCFNKVHKMYDNKKDIQFDYISSILLSYDTYNPICYMATKKEEVKMKRDALLKIMGNYYYWFEDTITRNIDIILKSFKSRNYTSLMYHPGIHPIILSGIDIISPIPYNKEDLIASDFMYKVVRAKRFLSLDRERLEIIFKSAILNRHK